MSLHHCVDESAVIRDGHKPFARTIGDALTQLATRSPEDAWKRDELEKLRRGKERNRFGKAA
jgi:hypothetical protein